MKGKKNNNAKFIGQSSDQKFNNLNLCSPIVSLLTRKSTAVQLLPEGPLGNKRSM